jgi:hypothetical protein
VDTATVSVIASSVVAVAAIGAGLVQHRGRLRHEREVVDLDNVRDVLDEAAVTLHKVTYTLDRVPSELAIRREFTAEGVTETPEQLRAGSEAIAALLERLSVRLGRDHPVVREFAAADGAVLKVLDVLEVLRATPEPPAGLPALPWGGRDAEFVREQEAKVGTNRERFDVARERFVAAAN